jgi:hypothetical protein
MSQETLRTKGQDEMFCPSCGVIIKREAVICIHCGVPIRAIIRGSGNRAPGEKSQTTAIFLAFFLGFWAWLYTIQKDWAKFFICCLLQLIALTFFFFAGFAYSDYDQGAQLFFLIIGGLIYLSSWLWPVIQFSIRGQDFYDNYTASIS